MSDPQGLFHWPGLYGLVSAQMSWRHGTAPSICTLRAPLSPQLTNGLKPFGTLRITYGRLSIQFPECKVASVRIEAASATAPITAVVTIKDRRWKWVWGDARGEYNRREGEAKINKASEKNPRKLAKLLFEMLGENRTDLSALPDEDRPLVDWDGPPAERLNRLCEAAGCVPTLNPLNNIAGVCRLGVGRDLPNGPIESDAFTLDAPDIPDKMIFQGGDSIFETDLELESLAEENDGSYVPFDKASYKPNDGWGGEVPPNFLNLPANVRDLATKSIYRAWRPKMPIRQWKGVWAGELKGIERILPLGTSQVQLAKLDKDGDEEAPAKAIIYGSWNPGHDSVKAKVKHEDTVNGKQAIWEGGVQFDTARGVIITSQPLYRYVNAAGKDLTGSETAEGGIKPAKLWLRTGIVVRDKETHAPLRYELPFTPPGQKHGTPAMYIKRSDQVLTYRMKRVGGAWRPVTNERDIKAAGKFYVNQELERLRADSPGTRVLRGIFEIETDGVLREVTWIVDGEGNAITQVSKNTESLITGLSYEAIREIQVMKDIRAKDKRGEPERERRRRER